MFSIIIPLYNKENYVLKTINSILHQSYQNFELIIINDGSTDKSYEVVTEFIENFKNKTENFNQKVRVINQENQGVSVTRNNGAKIAKFDYLAYLDADDWWEENYLEEMKLLITKFPDAALYGSAYYKIKNNKKIKSEIGVDKDFNHGYINYFKVYKTNFYYMPLWVGATVIKKEALMIENGFKSFLKWGEDFDLWIRIALKNKVAFTNIFLSNYNQDIDYANRAMNDSLHPVKHNFLFNTSCFENDEKANKDLKNLLDKFRLYSLFQYYIEPDWHSNAVIELRKVNFRAHKIGDVLKYNLPIILTKTFYKLKIKIYNQIKNLIKKI